MDPGFPSDTLDHDHHLHKPERTLCSMVQKLQLRHLSQVADSKRLKLTSLLLFLRLLVKVNII